MELKFHLIHSHPHLHTKRSSLQSDTYQMSYWYSQFSWWWAHDCPKHVENKNKHTWKWIVRQVGYLQRLYRDARWTEHQIPQYAVFALSSGCQYSWVFPKWRQVSGTSLFEIAWLIRLTPPESSCSVFYFFVLVFALKGKVMPSQ